MTEQDESGPKPDAQRLAHRIAHLATLTDPAQPPYTRRAFTPTFETGRRWLAGEYAAAGLEAAPDAGGNLVGRRPGENDRLRPIALGSHSDTVVGGGRYDGIAGVLAGLEIAQTLHERGVRLRHPLWVVDFLAEEPTDYGPSCVGSRAIAGTLNGGMLATTNPAGETLAQAIARMGGDPARIEQGPLYGRPPFAAMLELHIEQGPVLEREGVAVGVVSGVVGIRRMRLHVVGQADHAGTTPMPLRRDALVGAAELIAHIHRRARDAWESHGLVATVGRMTHEPNQANVVPSAAWLTFEARAPSMKALVDFMDTVVREGRDVLAGYGLELEDTLVQDAEPTPFAEPVRAALRAGAERRGHTWRDIQSGAGHDAMHLARVCPAGMVFVPSRGGRSHASEEFTTTEELLPGVEVLLDAVLELDRTLDP